MNTTNSQLLHLYMVIKPEKAKGPFAVSLWATWTGESGPRVMAAPQSSWHDFASRLENSGLLDSDSLGCVDAHVARGEPTVRYVSCSLEDLESIGLRDVPESDAKGLPGQAGALYQKLSGTPRSFSTSPGTGPGPSRPSRARFRRRNAAIPGGGPRPPGLR